jgi:hypothetical protein
MSDKREITLSVTLDCVDPVGRDLMFGPRRSHHLVQVGCFASSYSRTNSTASWFTRNGEALVCLRLASVSQPEADSISNALEKMLATGDTAPMIAAFPEATKRALGDGVELKVIETGVRWPPP